MKLKKIFYFLMDLNIFNVLSNVKYIIEYLYKNHYLVKNMLDSLIVFVK